MSQDSTFDPYCIWLGIPPEEQPPHHYRLLGVRLFESNTEVIANAADARMIHLKTFQTGRYSALSQQLLNAVSSAKLCLLNPQARAAYDAQLQQWIRARSAQIDRPVSPPMPAPPTPAPPTPSTPAPSIPSPSFSPQPPSMPQSPARQPTGSQSAPSHSPPVQPPAPTPGRSSDVPLGGELPRIGDRRISSYVYRHRRTSLAAATIIISILTVILGLVFLLMAI